MTLIYQQCESNNGWQEVRVPSSDPSKPPYLVMLPPWDREQEEILCECEGYLYRGLCRHQLEALDAVCGWNGLDGPSQTKRQRKDQECPRCGGRTRTVIEDEDVNAQDSNASA